MENIIDKELSEEKESSKPRLAWRNKFKKFRNAPLGMIAIGIFLIIYTSFGVAYLQKQNEVSDIEDEISSQTAIFNKLSPSKDIGQLEGDLAKAQAALVSDIQESNQRLGSLPKLEHNIDTVNAILELGSAANLDNDAIVVSSHEDTDLTNMASMDLEMRTDFLSGDKGIQHKIQATGDLAGLLEFTSAMMTQQSGLLSDLDFEQVEIVQSWDLLGDLKLETTTELDISLLIHPWDNTASGDEELLLSTEERE